MAENTISITEGARNANLQTIFSKVNHVYYDDKSLNKEKIVGGVVMNIELPIIEGTLSLNTGTAEVTEVKLLDGTVWTSLATKGDADISFQVASIDQNINKLFLTEGVDYGTVSIDGTSFTKGKGYKLDINKALGSLLLRDDTGKAAILLPNVEMYAAFVAGDSDNPAYFNVTVTPKANSDGDSIIMFAE